MQERRAQILSAARRVFAEKGLSKVTLRDVFREAGLSAGAVYNYFQSKDDLILGVTEAGMAEALSAFGGAAVGADLDAIIDIFFDALANMDPGQAPRVDLMIATEALANTDVHRAVVKNRAAVRAALVRLIERRQATRGDWTGHAAPVLADFLYATYQGLILSVALGEKPDITGIGRALKAMRFD
ncbi:TetR/AcrR family transcriptional regulator [Roseibacterium sp. SDUM158017]|uniref:TetR/AcrR family transcriptional regulator n=1 Tax=Roseicyclus salinarum TaxID=3036773 RepID=UPI0024150E49|nr:TetR/AcrR family transcriptional regulator [Roseibacterium sp. SDUM158017]MDG4650363.1 TetR/AcrR family transcriptional regulator [Roseibacterium sp. SDUM158017]